MRVLLTHPGWDFHRMLNGAVATAYALDCRLEAGSTGLVLRRTI